jgi:PAS domain S-box-containing protein
MAETQELTASLFLHASEGIIVADQKGKIVMANPRAEQMLGY